MDPNIKDDLNFLQDKSFLKNLEPNEKIILSTNISKYNDYKKRQERSIVLTNTHLYNMKEKEVKRRIALPKIKAVIISLLSSEFILHVPEEYDYRYQSQDKRQTIIYCIIKQIALLSKIKTQIFLKEEVSLFNFATTKSDKKKGVNKLPTENPELMDDNDFLRYCDGENQEKNESRTKTTTLWAREKGKQVCLEDFIPLKVLGRGAFGKVTLVSKKDNPNEWLAMKQIRKDDIINKDQLEHTRTEKMILEHVNHPFLVNLVYAFQTPVHLYFALQFMRGGELFQHLRMSRKFEEKRARFYSAQLILALGHLHSKDIVYRDLKLENILMDEEGNVMLTDFGMAKIVRKNELAMTFCGTPEYLSPEVIQGYGCDRTADWWSLGILTYEMMFGLPPFYNKNQTVMFKLIKDGELKFPEKPEISVEAKDFIARLLNRDKNARLGAKQDMNELVGHPWFKDINWDQMMKKALPTPFKPKVHGEQWLENFDKEFTSESIENSEEKNLKPNKNYDEHFKNF